MNKYWNNKEFIFDFISYSNNYLEILINNSFSKNHNFHYDLIYHENNTKISNIIFKVPNYSTLKKHYNCRRLQIHR